MARIVLVHGAFSGAWVWEPIVDDLRSAGHSVETLDLPGSGDDQTPVEQVTLDAYAGRVSDSGEGRWTVQAANEAGVPAHVLTAALFERFGSRGEDLFQNKVLSAMRKGFGGHVEKR